MTYIKAFTISGLAGRKGHVSHHLDRHVNIFWGLNGSGKTTALRILNAALSNETQQLSSLPFESASVVFYSESIDRDILRTFSKSDPRPEFRQDIIDFRSHSELTLGADWNTPELDTTDPGWNTEILGDPLGPQFEGAERHFLETTYARKFLPISRVVGTQKANARSGRPNDVFTQRVNEVWQQYSANSLVSIETVQRQGLASVLAILFGGTRNLLEIGEDPVGSRPVDATEAFRTVSAFLRDQRLYLPLGQEDFERRYELSEENQKVVARIQTINAMIDDIRAPQRELQAVIEEMYIGNKHLEFEVSVPRSLGTLSIVNDTDRIPLTSLSSGEKQLLQILLETLAAETSAVLIDEPELSLHPDWQKRLVGSMRRVNSGAQFILATHSPDLMIHVPYRCVFEL